MARKKAKKEDKAGGEGSDSPQKTKKKADS